MNVFVHILFNVIVNLFVIAEGHAKKFFRAVYFLLSLHVSVCPNKKHHTYIQPFIK